MKCSELIAKLQTMPQDHPVFFVYDGMPRGQVMHAWQAVNGQIIMADSCEPIYANEHRPDEFKNEIYWSTP